MQRSKAQGPENIAVLILAAGKGKRTGSALPKVLLSTREKPLILHVLEKLSTLNPKFVTVITGHGRELVETAVKNAATGLPINFAVQTEQLGTGDAVKSALPALRDFAGTVVIIYGDVPLISGATLKSFVDHHWKAGATLSLISFPSEDGHAYGRIIRDKSGKNVTQIIEAKDCTPEQFKINESNSGIYAVDSSFLTPAVNAIKNENAQSEYYLTDIVEMAVKEGQTVSAYRLEDGAELQGVNTLMDMLMVNKEILKKKTAELVAAGVIFVDPATVYIDSSVTVGAGTTIGPDVQLLGKTSVGRDCVFEGSAYIKDSQIADGAVIKYSVRMEGASVGPQAMIGPFAHLRPETKIDAEVKVGNFVEVKKSHLHKGVKAPHLTYLGDSEVGERSNIGAGTITCNYDGYKKSKTTIGKDVFIGSNTAIVAPVSVADGAIIGAGSVITKDVEQDSLAVSRAPQVNKAGWAKRRRELLKK